MYKDVALIERLITLLVSSAGFSIRKGEAFVPCYMFKFVYNEALRLQLSENRVKELHGSAHI